MEVLNARGLGEDQWEYIQTRQSNSENFHDQLMSGTYSWRLPEKMMAKIEGEIQKQIKANEQRNKDLTNCRSGWCSCSPTKVAAVFALALSSFVAWYCNQQS